MASGSLCPPAGEGRAAGSGFSAAMSSCRIGSFAPIALCIIQRSVTSLRPWFLLPPPMSEWTPRNQTSHAPCDPDRQERRPALVERQRMEAVLQVRLRQRQMVPDVQRGVAEIGEPERADDVPDAEKANLREGSTTSSLPGCGCRAPGCSGRSRAWSPRRG